MKTKDQLATEILGHNDFDCALPQPWLDYAVDRTGCDYHTLLGGTVWNYGEAKTIFGSDGASGLFGRATAITIEASDILGQLHVLEDADK